MNNNNKWLTLIEVVGKSRLSDMETRRIIKEFGRFLSPVKFGDMVKYPPAVMQAVDLIGDLFKQGCTSEEVSGILSRRRQVFTEHHLEQLNTEIINCCSRENQAYQLLGSVMEAMQKMLADMEVLMVKLAAAKKVMDDLEEERLHNLP